MPRIKKTNFKIQKGANRYDHVLLLTSLALIILGILILSSVSSTLSYEKFGNPYYFLSHQIIYGLIPGLILGFFCYKQKLNWFKEKSLILLFLALFLAGLVFAPGVGLESGGAKRWVNIGIISFQPSEFLKIAFFVYLASWLQRTTQSRESGVTIRKRKKYNTKINLFSSFIPFIIILILVGVFLIYQRNLSTLGIIVAVGTIMYFIANTYFWHTPLILAGIAAVFWIFIINVPYRLSRLLVFLNPEKDPLGAGYQIKQSLIAIGSGGLFGLGLGMSRQKFGFLPESISDAIFPVFAEETGFIGAIILILLFLIFMWRGIKIAKEAKDNFSQLLATGITSWIFLQTLINIGAMIKLVPLTGIPLPLISYGGSHIVAELIAIGLLLNISKKS